MGVFRSEEMCMCQMFLPADSAYNCTAELGELGLVQFRDLNPDTNNFQRRYVNEVRRCDEMERQLRFISRQITHAGLPIYEPKDENDFKAPPTKEMIDLEATFSKIEDELKEINTNGDALKKTQSELLEVRSILEIIEPFFQSRERSGSLLQPDELQLVGPGDTVNLGFIAGVMPRDKVANFELLLWRVCRGITYLKQEPISLPVEDPVTGEWTQKNVILVFFQGEQLKGKVQKIVKAFHSTVYPIPDTTAGRRELLDNVKSRLEDLKKVRQETQDHRNRVLMAAARKIRQWFIQIRKMKATFHTLNLCNMDITSKCLLAECWVPTGGMGFIQNALNQGLMSSGSSVQAIFHKVDTDETPPTYNHSNKFTKGFQALIDAYGVAGYMEINPTPFTVITFPFLFAVMFGDSGHGLLMFLFALWMVVKEKSLAAQKSDNEIWNTFFGGRYIILLMGAFSCYTGWIYNDCFSKAINIFGSSWVSPGNATDTEVYPHLFALDPDRDFKGTPYIFGVDPVWVLSTNKIPFTNSFKMKMSIVLGVMQMLFGVFLSLGNHMFHRDNLSIYTEFIPQLIFLCSIFGYLVVAIFAKWAIKFQNTNCAPSLLIMLINMFMFKESHEPCFQAPFYSGQSTVQAVLVVCAVVCIPWLLFIKPFVLRSRHQRAQTLSASSRSPLHQETALTEGEVEAQANHVAPSGGHGHGSNKEFDFGDTFINQIIHAIEYCLGSVSHTASYLRLWALSLAHAQLSEVLWNMVFRMGLSNTESWGFVMVFVMFAAWAVLTICVLLLMEGLSAFLHALRLHWVEFQSKFYHGDGYMFEPFVFKSILEKAEAEDRALPTK